MAGSTELAEQVAALEDHLKRFHRNSLIKISFSERAPQAEENNQSAQVGAEEKDNDEQKFPDGYDNLLASINQIEIQDLPFSASQRTQQKLLKKADVLFSAFLRKVVGKENKNQAAFLIHQLKKLCPKGNYLNVVIEDMKMMNDISNLNDKQLKNYEKNNSLILKTFDTFLMKLAGSLNPVSQRKILRSC